MGIPILNHQHKIISELLCSSETLYPQEIVHSQEESPVAIPNLKSFERPLLDISYINYKISTTSDETTITKYLPNKKEPLEITLKTS